MGEIHQLLRDRGRKEVLKLDHDRRVVDAATMYMAAEDNEIGFFYSGWAQSGLPHKRQPDGANWHVKSEHVSLLVEPGTRHDTSGTPVPLGVPYGSRARLILLYLQSEALRNNSREVELGRSLHAWLRHMDIPIGGKSMATVRDQAERISRCRLSFQIRHAGRTGLVNQNIMDTAMFVDDDSAQTSLFVERARLSEMFFEQLKRHPVPIEEAAVRSIANNSMAIDVYCWLTYRLHVLSAPVMITWKALHAQFGAGYSGVYGFSSSFKSSLELALSVYPDAKVEVGRHGVTLKPSKPPVSPKVVSIRPKTV